MRARGQLLSALVVLAVVVGGGLYLQDRVGTEAFAAGPAGSAPSGAWLCPHGGGQDWQTTLEVANPGEADVRIRVTRMSEARPTDARSYVVPAGTTLPIAAPSTSRGSASFVEYFGGWVAAGWVTHGGGGEGGVAAEPCLPSASATWFLPDGSAVEHEDDYLVVMNPFATEAVFTIALFTNERVISTGDWTNVVLKPFRSDAFRLNPKALGDETVSARISVKVGRVGAASLGISDLGGIRASVGLAGSADLEQILPGGFDQGRSELIVENAGAQRPGVDGRMLGPEGAQAIGALAEQNPNQESARTIPVTTDGPSSFDVVAARPAAFARRTFGRESDQGATSGATAASTAWVVLPAVAGDPSHAGLVLANPGDVDATVTLAALGETGVETPTPVTVNIPPGATVAAPKAFVEAAASDAIVAVARSGTFVPASASYSLGREGYATYAVSTGVPIPAAWVSSVATPVR
jgi:hypothetical protein